MKCLRNVKYFLKKKYQNVEQKHLKYLNFRFKIKDHAYYKKKLSTANHNAN